MEGSSGDAGQSQVAQTRVDDTATVTATSKNETAMTVASATSLDAHDEPVTSMLAPLPDPSTTDDNEFLRGSSLSFAPRSAGDQTTSASVASQHEHATTAQHEQSAILNLTATPNLNNDASDLNHTNESSGNANSHAAGNNNDNNNNNNNNNNSSNSDGKVGDGNANDGNNNSNYNSTNTSNSNNNDNNISLNTNDNNDNNISYNSANSYNSNNMSYNTDVSNDHINNNNNNNNNSDNNGTNNSNKTSNSNNSNNNDNNNSNNSYDSNSNSNNWPASGLANSPMFLPLSTSHTSSGGDIYDTHMAAEAMALPPLAEEHSPHSPLSSSAASPQHRSVISSPQQHPVSHPPGSAPWSAGYQSHLFNHPPSSPFSFNNHNSHSQASSLSHQSGREHERIGSDVTDGDDVSVASSVVDPMTVSEATAIALSASAAFLKQCVFGVSTTGYVYDERCVLHQQPHAKHPECPERVQSIMQTLTETGLAAKMRNIPARVATNEEIQLVHSTEHVASVLELRDENVRAAKKEELTMNSAYANQYTTDAAFVSAGGVLAIVQEIAAGRIRNGLTVLRPPGHHAECSHVTGFCFFNNIAIAAAWLTRKAERVVADRPNRVVVVDWDVHHGNGTQHLFEEDKNVLYISIHRWDNGQFYPNGPDGGPNMVGLGEGRGYNINIGWNGDGPFGDAEILAAWNAIVLPACRAFAPDYVLVSAGFDAAAGDPLGGCLVSPGGYGHLLHALCSLAEGRVLVSLEGGYNLRALAESTVACVGVLLGHPPPPLPGPHVAPCTSAFESIRATALAHMLVHETDGGDSLPHPMSAWPVGALSDVVLMRQQEQNARDEDEDERSSLKWEGSHSGAADHDEVAISHDDVAISHDDVNHNDVTTDKKSAVPQLVSQHSLRSFGSSMELSSPRVQANNSEEDESSDSACILQQQTSGDSDNIMNDADTGGGSISNKTLPAPNVTRTVQLTDAESGKNATRADSGNSILKNTVSTVGDGNDTTTTPPQPTLVDAKRGKNAAIARSGGGIVKTALSIAQQSTDSSPKHSNISNGGAASGNDDENQTFNASGSNGTKAKAGTSVMMVLERAGTQSSATEIIEADLGSGGIFKIKPLKFSPNVALHVCTDETEIRAKLGTVSEACGSCGTDKECWACLKCLQVFCGRYVKAHMVEHAKLPGHCVAVSFADLSVWDFELDSYLDTLLIEGLKPVYRHLHMLKFGTEPVFPGGNGSGSSSGVKRSFVNINGGGDDDESTSPPDMKRAAGGV